jgi:hypothetical protein
MPGSKGPFHHITFDEVQVLTGVGFEMESMPCNKGLELRRWYRGDLWRRARFSATPAR